MINNHYLFSSQFRSYLHAQELEDPAFFEGFVATVGSFLQAAATADLDALTQRVIAPILTQLQFANPPLEPAPAAPAARSAYLYDGFPLTNRVSCVYVVPNSPPGRGQGWVLDVAEKGNFPAFDLIRLLQQANLEWGMLTNGLVWRLCSTRASQPYEQYLEIDFSDAQPEDFKIFWQLFSLALFLPDEQELTPLETYIAESQQEAAVIEKHIKSKIEALLENICVGLLTYAGKDKQPLTEAEQQSYFDNAVYLLFRLLFVLYAESRELLPARDPAYQAVSLQTLIQQAHAWKQAGLVNAAGVELWDGFRDLCDKIQFGDPQLNIPEYDGGLFDSREHPFLADPRNKVSNLYFVNVLDLLGYRTVRKEAQPINYRDLSVRSLGSLYEGILEYKLFLATEELVLRGQTLIPRKEAGKVKKTERVIAPGQVYFAQAANERHDTGSYYTPEEVVNYMVQHSVRMGLEERRAAFQPTVERYAREVRQAASEDVRRALRRKFDQELLAFVETQVLSFKVLDPAMGSGHFLVNALHAITHFILEVLQGGGEPAAANLLVHHNPDIDLTPAVWRRKAAERCIFGVDLNPLAAELAKLSLWIASAAAGKPLTFLNHHLKCGNSLIGAQLKEIGRYPLTRKKTKDDGQLGLLERDQGFLITVQEVLQRLENIVAQDSENIEQIGSKKQWLKEAQVALQPYKALCDFHTSLFFGNELSHDAYDNTLLAFTPEFSWNDETFFHWELEFPDVLLKGKGFDAVIGNPPWGADLGKTVNYLNNTYQVASGQYDSYDLFFERMQKTLKGDAYFSMIIPDSIFRTEHLSIRKLLIFNTSIRYILKLGEGLFEDVYSACVIIVYKNLQGIDNNIINTFTLTKSDRNKLKSGLITIQQLIENRYELINQSRFANNKLYEFNIFVNSIDEEILALMAKNPIDINIFESGRGVELSKTGEVLQCPYCKMWDSMPSGKNKAMGKKCSHCLKIFTIEEALAHEFIISENSRSGNDKLFLSGESINRYNITNPAYIDISKQGINYKSQSLYEGEKILIRKTGIGIYATIEDSGCYTNQVVFIYKLKEPSNLFDEKINLKYFLALLNSRLMLYYYFKQVGEIEWKSFPYITQSIINNFPLKKINFKDISDMCIYHQIVDNVRRIIKEKYLSDNFKKLDLELEELVMNIYSITPKMKDHIYQELKKVQQLRIIRELFW